MKFLNNLLTDNEQKILAFLVVFAFIGLMVQHTGLIAQAADECADDLDFQTDYEIKYDLRNVTVGELITIPGIGEKRAGDILTFREENGFQNKTDLMKVVGFGMATYNKIEAYFLDFGNVEITESSSPSSIEFGQKININTASAEELTAIKGIGTTRAEQIIALRNELGKFSSCEDLLQISGIGPKSLEKIRDQITLGD